MREASLFQKSDMLSCLMALVSRASGLSSPPSLPPQWKSYGGEHKEWWVGNHKKHKVAPLQLVKVISLKQNLH